MHGAFLNFKGCKMSKSAWKIKTVSELDFDPLAFKYFCYTAHYRKPLSWSSSAIDSAVDSYERLKNIVLSLEDDGKVNKKYLREFEERINDDLDMPGAVAVLWRLLRSDARGKVGVVRKMDSVFGLKLLDVEKVSVPHEVLKISQGRLIARRNKDWEKADELRREIEAKGWKIKDVGDGFELEEI